LESRIGSARARRPFVDHSAQLMPVMQSGSGPDLASPFRSLPAAGVETEITGRAGISARHPIPDYPRQKYAGVVTIQFICYYFFIKMAARSPRRARIHANAFHFY